MSNSVGPAVQSAVFDCLPIATPVSPGSVNRSLPQGHVLNQAVVVSPRTFENQPEGIMNIPSKEARLHTVGEVKINDIEEGEKEQAQPNPSTNERQRLSLNISKRIQNGAVRTVAVTAELAAATLTLALPAAASAASAATGHAIMGIHHDGYDVSEGVKAAVTGSLLAGVPSYALGRAIGLCCGIKKSENSFGETLKYSTREAFGGAFLTAVIGAAFRQNELGVDDDISLGNHCLAGIVGGLIIGVALCCCTKKPE
ncbi:MAG: hypothetical protein AB8G77_04735 [Rhodothermales bacterium]